MSKCSQDQYRKETTTNNEFSVKQDNNDQQQLSSIQSYSSSNDTPTKISTLTEKEDIIHSQEVQATDDMPPLASLLSCFVRIERCQKRKKHYHYTEISSIVSPSNSPSRRHPKENVEHDTVAEDLQEKYQALLRRFEQTVHISSDALNLSRISEYAPSTMTSDLRLLLNDLTNYNNGKKQENYHKDTRTVTKTKPIESIEDHEEIKPKTQDSIISATTKTIGQRHAIQHHEIDRSTLRINRHQSRLRRSHSASSKTREGSLQKGFLCASTNALNVRPLVHKHDFNDPTITIDNEITTNVKTTTKHHLLLGNENDLVQVLNEQFPGIYVSTEMQAKLYDQFSKHIDSVFKSRVELLNSQQGNIND
ncbi:unnamed protein product, partial [Rotaria magnacalcarata]